MSVEYLVPLLALFTMLTLIVFALVSKKRTEDRMDSDAPKSSLAADGPDHRKAP